MTDVTAQQSPTRAAFALRFGEDQAAAIEAAASMHENDAHGNRGTDPFKWALCISIGYQCWEIDGYRKYHGITAPADEVAAWIKERADLGTHDGDVDYLAMYAGAYESYLPVGQS